MKRLRTNGFKLFMREKDPRETQLCADFFEEGREDCSLFKVFKSPILYGSIMLLFLQKFYLRT